ncbi:hypothetical protein [Desulfurobacterium sp.]
MSKQKRDFIFFIEDILMCIEKIERYTKNLTFKVIESASSQSVER